MSQVLELFQMTRYVFILHEIYQDSIGILHIFLTELGTDDNK